MPGTGIMLKLVATHGLQPDELDVEDESRVGRDDLTKPARTCGSKCALDEGFNTPLGCGKRTVCLPRWDSENALLVETHVKKSFLPSRNDLAGTNCTLGRQKGQPPRYSAL